jgi:hypothetical protein
MNKPMYKVFQNDMGMPVIEIFENDNVRITRFLLTGETEVEFKPNCDKKVIKMYHQLIKPIKRGD